MRSKPVDREVEELGFHGKGPDIYTTSVVNMRRQRAQVNARGYEILVRVELELIELCILNCQVSYGKKKNKEERRSMRF